MIKQQSVYLDSKAEQATMQPSICWFESKQDQWYSKRIIPFNFKCDFACLFGFRNGDTYCDHLLQDYTGRKRQLKNPIDSVESEWTVENYKSGHCQEDLESI